MHGFPVEIGLAVGLFASGVGYGAQIPHFK